MGSVYSKKEMSDIAMKKDIQVLKPLLSRIKDEESEVYCNIESTPERFDTVDYAKSFVLFSKTQVFKSYSIYGLMKYYNRSTKYYITDLSMLVDVWWNNSKIIDKSLLLSCDILIINGDDNTAYQLEPRTEVLKDVVRVRRTYGKVTWLFMGDTSKETFESRYKGVLGCFDTFNTSEF